MFDDDDPSEDWVSQSISGSHMMHTPNGPLGSSSREQVSSASVSAQVSPSVPNYPSNGPATNGASTNGNGATTPVRPGVQINGGRNRRAEPQGSPISNSVQENFRGFSFSGESFHGGPSGRLAEEGEEVEEALEDEGSPSPEEEYEYDQPGGRTANRKGPFSDL